MENWRSKINPQLKKHLELQIKESAKNKRAIKSAKNKAISQLWCSIALLSKQNSELNLKFKYLEQALKDLKPQKQQQKTTQKEVDKIIKTMQKF